MSTYNLGFFEDLIKIIFELSSNIIKYAPYFFCCMPSTVAPSGFSTDQICAKSPAQSQAGKCITATASLDVDSKPLLLPGTVALEGY